MPKRKASSGPSSGTPSRATLLNFFRPSFSQNAENRPTDSSPTKGKTALTGKGRASSTSVGSLSVLGMTPENALLVDDSSDDDVEFSSAVATKKARRIEIIEIVEPPALKQQPASPARPLTPVLMSAESFELDPSQYPSDKRAVKQEDQDWEAGDDEFTTDLVADEEDQNDVALVEMDVTGDEELNEEFGDADVIGNPATGESGLNSTLCPVCSMVFDDDENVSSLLHCSFLIALSHRYLVL